jgi:hypothetical protein
MKSRKTIWVWFVYVASFLFIVLLAQNYKLIPTRKQHMSRNKYNILPANKLRLLKEPYYIDDNHIMWRKRAFLQSLFHNPFKNYTFETMNPKKVSSSEAIIIKSDFDKGIMRFRNGTFNFYSSYTHPIEHFFADVLPIALYYF